MVATAHYEVHLTGRDRKSGQKGRLNVAKYREVFEVKCSAVCETKDLYCGENLYPFKMKSTKSRKSGGEVMVEKGYLVQWSLKYILTKMFLIIC